MKKLAMVMCLLLGGSSWATLLTDDFNRGDTAYSTDSTIIGSSWVSSLGDDRSAIKSNTLAFDVPLTLSANHLFYNTGIALSAGTAGGSSWTYSADVKIDGAGMYGGIAFNILDANNFYALRIKAGYSDYQMIRVVNGVTSSFVSQSNLTAPIAAGGAYTFTVSSDVVDNFTFTITAAGSSTVLNPQTTTSLGTSGFDNGYAGFYHWTGLGSRLPDATYDNFSVNVIPEPATIGLLGIGAILATVARKYSRITR